MRILQVVPCFPPAYAFGGPVKVVYQISKELVRRGHEVTVYTTDAKDFNSRVNLEPVKFVDGIKVYYFRNLTLMLVKKFKLFITPQLVLHAKSEVGKFDIVHLHEYRTFQNILVAHYAKKHDVPYVLQAHGSLPRIMAWPRLKWIYDVLFGYRLLRDSSKVIALNHVEAKQYKAMGVPEEKLAIIPNGINLSEYAKLPPKGNFKKKFNIPEDKKIILYLGRIHRIKGVDFLIKAYAYLKNEMNYKNAVLVIAGPDDGYLKEAQGIANRLGISKNVLFTGQLYGRDKLEAYVDSEFYVLPSRYETFPMAALEAYACGKPIIASNVGGLRELVVNGETGLLIDVGDIDQLAKAIHSLLNNEAEVEKMGSKGMQYVKSNFSIEKVVERLEKVYEEAVEK